LPYYRIGGLTEEEYIKIKEMSTLGYSPAVILSTLQHANLELLLVQHDVYNLLHNLRVEELAGSTPIEWLLKVYLLLVLPLFPANNLQRNSRKWTSVHKNTQIKPLNALNSFLHFGIL
jgi:hypothetical protein